MNKPISHKEISEQAIKQAQNILIKALKELDAMGADPTHRRNGKSGIAPVRIRKQKISKHLYL